MREIESSPRKFASTALIVLVCCLLYCRNGAAMTFDVVAKKGEPCIVGRGEIVAGDAGRLLAVLTPAAKHSEGYYSLALESPGGSVDAAFKLSKVIDSVYVNTYVATGGTCVSACAAIVFIAGREHVAVRGSRLGFHGCYDANTKRIVGLCNEEIAKHAVAHGTAYGSVMAFIHDTPADNVVWFTSREADCWGINRYGISPKPVIFEECVRLGIENVDNPSRAEAEIRRILYPDQQER
jgi:hypothetical protein